MLRRARADPTPRCLSSPRTRMCDAIPLPANRRSRAAGEVGSKFHAVALHGNGINELSCRGVACARPRQFSDAVQCAVIHRSSASLFDCASLSRQPIWKMDEEEPDEDSDEKENDPTAQPVRLPPPR